MASTSDDLVWHKVLNADELPEGRVTSATCAHLTLCMTRYRGQYGALDNKCPHQGGPPPVCPSRVRAPPTCSPGCGTPTWTAHRRSRTTVSVWWKFTATLSWYETGADPKMGAPSISPPLVGTSFLAIH